MSIDRLPGIAAKLNSNIEILQVHDSKDSSRFAIQAGFVCQDYRTWILESEVAGTINGALESLLQKFEEVGR